MEQGEWTEADVQRILSNPIYVGIGNYPQVSTENVWIKAQKRRAEEVRTALPETLRYSLPHYSI